MVMEMNRQEMARYKELCEEIGKEIIDTFGNNII